MRKNINIAGTDLLRRMVSFRKERHLTQSDLADKAGLSSRTICDLEGGKRDRVQEKTLMLLAKALEVSYDELFGDTMDDTNDETNCENTGNSNGKSDQTADQVAKPPWWRRSDVPLLMLVTLVLVAGLWLVTSRAQCELEWSRDNDQLVARDQLLGMKHWEREFGADIFVCEPSPWSTDVILVRLSGETVAGGRLLALDSASGRTLWELEPDLEALARAFGKDVVYSGNYHCQEIVKPDLNGDRIGELVVRFGHSM